MKTTKEFLSDIANKINEICLQYPDRLKPVNEDTIEDLYNLYGMDAVGGLYSVYKEQKEMYDFVSSGKGTFEDFLNLKKEAKV